MPQTDSSTEYAIELPGRGYIGWLGNFSTEIEGGIQSFDDAQKMLDNAKRKYIHIGCPDIAETMRIASRTVTVTRGDWEIIT